MASESKLGGFFEKIQDKLQEQPAYQQVRAKWDELDPRHRQIVSGVAIFGSFFVLVLATITLYQDVSDKQSALEEKVSLAKHLSRSQDELRRLRENNPFSGSLQSDEPWIGYIESQATQIGIAPDSVKVTEGKNAAVGESKLLENNVDVSVKKINVRQLVKLVFQLENGTRPAKVKSLQVDTEPDESGYLNLNFTLLTYQTPKK